MCVVQSLFRGQVGCGGETTGVPDGTRLHLRHRDLGYGWVAGCGQGGDGGEGETEATWQLFGCRGTCA